MTVYGAFSGCPRRLCIAPETASHKRIGQEICEQFGILNKFLTFFPPLRYRTLIHSTTMLLCLAAPAFLLLESKSAAIGGKRKENGGKIKI